MEKLKKDLFLDKQLTSRKRMFAGWCITSVAGTVTKCSNGLMDMGQ